MLSDVLESLTDRDEVLVSKAHLVLGCDPSTIYRWLSKGRLERMETDRGVYVNVGDLRRVSAEVKPGRPRRVA